MRFENHGIRIAAIPATIAATVVFAGPASANAQPVQPEFSAGNTPADIRASQNTIEEEGGAASEAEKARDDALDDDVARSHDGISFSSSTRANIDNIRLEDLTEYNALGTRAVRYWLTRDMRNGEGAERMSKIVKVTGNNSTTREGNVDIRINTAKPACIKGPKVPIVRLVAETTWNANEDANDGKKTTTLKLKYGKNGDGC